MVALSRLGSDGDVVVYSEMKRSTETEEVEGVEMSGWRIRWSTACGLQDHCTTASIV